jgi:spermidine synthase
VGAALNTLLAIWATALTMGRATEKVEVTPSSIARPKQVPTSRTPLVLLFSTGLTSMAIEVVWIRQFTPYLGTVVYAFALILSSYLAATFLGSRIYRYWSRHGTQEGGLIWVLLGVSVLLPLITADPTLHVGPLPVGDWLVKMFHLRSLEVLTPHPTRLSNVLRLVLGIGPFSAILGFVTPMLVDRWSGGDPDIAGKAYAVNVVGCILGPLLSGFLLLPWMNERWVLFLFSLPWFFVGLLPRWSASASAPQSGGLNRLRYWPALLAVLLVSTSKGYEDQFTPRVVLRDNTATVVATGEGMHKLLKVNGVGMTELTPLTKIMAHLTLASLDHTPQSSLVVCFGMGTTYRSLHSWGIATTAVELVPSVPRLFGYYHADGPEVLGSPLSRVIVDDGRRYLERTPEQYDSINLDPPPPVQAAGSSLLYSKEFYAIAKQRLRPGGILEQWLPIDESIEDDPLIPAAVTRALEESFLYVRAFRNTTSPVGLLFLASDHPIAVRTPEALVQRMPAAAKVDLLEWAAEKTAEKELAEVLNNELSLDELTAKSPHALALRDDQPLNEYCILRLLPVSQKWRRFAARFRMSPQPSAP